MLVLDTDTLTHLLRGQARVAEKSAQATAEVVLTAVTRIEVLQGRFAAVLKAENGPKLSLAYERLLTTEQDLANFVILPMDAAASARFDELRQMKRLKMGRADLLIAAIVLAHAATLVTRNLKDFCQVPGLQVENWVD